MKLFLFIFLAVFVLWTVEVVLYVLIGTTLPELFTGRWWVLVIANSFIADRIATAIVRKP